MMKEGTYPQPEQGASQEMPCEKCPFAREIGARAVSRAISGSPKRTTPLSSPPKGSTIEFALNNPKRYKEIIEDTYASMQEYRREVLEITDSSGLWRLQTEPRRRSLIDKVVGYIRDAMR